MTSAWHTKGPPPRRAPRLPAYSITLTTKTVSADLASDVRLPTGHICLVINDEGTVWACGAAPLCPPPLFTENNSGVINQ